jgi:type II secretory pathway pseudopilin PulG
MTAGRQHLRRCGASASNCVPRGGVAGFTLVELLVAIVVTVIAIVAIMASCIRLHALQRLDGEIGYAYRACRTNLETMRALPVSQLLALDGTGFEVPGSDGATPLLAARRGDADGLPGLIRVREERSAGGRTLYSIETTVAWRGATGSHVVSFTTKWGGVP